MGNVCKSRSSAVLVTDKFDKDLNDVSFEEEDDYTNDRST